MDIHLGGKLLIVLEIKRSGVIESKEGRNEEREKQGEAEGAGGIWF
jgi:hypothetical protein